MLNYYLRGGKILSMKKFTVALLSFLLAFSGMFVPKHVMAENNDLLDEIRSRLELEVSERSVTEAYEEYFKASDEVRIIVELQSKPGIVIATEKNTSYDSLSVAEQQAISRRLDLEQQAVKSEINRRLVGMTFKNSFTVAMNGFSGTVRFDRIKMIESLPNVKKVYLSNEYEKPEVEINMNTSNALVSAYETWALDYLGEGRVVAVLDTGIDYTHRDMVLAEDVEVALTEAEVNGLGLLGKYFTKKVPYGYNYFDLSNEVIDKGPDPSMHGQHVAGTVGANGNPEEGGIKGVSPHAQLLAMKVFSNDPLFPSTYSDIYLVAIDESIKLGADVINMSLGSTASFFIEDSAENVALQNAIDNGIVAAVSAGNSGHIAHGGASIGQPFGDYPWVQNADIGVVGAPGLNAPTISVASLENSSFQARFLTFMVGEEKKTAVMTPAGPVDPSTVPANTEYVDGGFGDPSLFPDVTGKVVLIQRGGPDAFAPFTEKIINAANAGAAAVIVYNHATGGEGVINMQYPAGVSIPAVFIGNKAGLEMLAQETKTLTFEKGTMSAPNPNAGKMSDFTSWGTTPTLEMKPELTAPGGQIYSTLNNDAYGIMSGTSMAAPHVAGGSALVMEYLNKHAQFKNLSPKEQSEFAKVLLMTTAVPVVHANGVPVSPRRQGAGNMNLLSAVTTPVVLTNTATGLAKVELRDFTETTFDLTLTAKNFADVPYTYNVDTTVLRDAIASMGGKYVNVTTSSSRSTSTVTAPETITVPARGETNFTVTVDISKDGNIMFLGDTFVDGFVRLTHVGDTLPDIGIPFIGFYGDWGQLPIIDGLWTSDNFGETYYDWGGFLFTNPSSGGLSFFVGDDIYLTPGTDAGEATGRTSMMPILSFLRNAENVHYNVLNEAGTSIRTILTEQFARKTFLNGGRANPYRIISRANWDGTVNGEVVPDGRYTYEITANVQGRENQTYEMPVVIDTTAPVVTNIEYDAETRTISFEAMDEYAGLNVFMFVADGELLDDVVYGDDEETEYSFVLPEAYADAGKVEIVAVDNLTNMDFYEVQVTPDTDPHLYIYSPGVFSYYDTNTVSVEGYVTNVNFLDRVMINGSIEADLTYVADATLTELGGTAVVYRGPAYKFTSELELPDGYQEVKIEAISRSGVESVLTRRIFVDTTAPVLKAEVLERKLGDPTATIRFHMSDNLGTLTLFRGDSQIFNYDHPLLIQGETEKTFDYTVHLPYGESVLNFKLVDAVGHEDTVTIKVEREVERVEGSNRYRTANEVSKKMFKTATDVVLASGENFPDALAGSVLGKAVNGPVLLTEKSVLSEATIEELERLGAENIHLLGGELAIEKSVENALVNLGYNVVRYAGSNRYVTAADIAEVVVDIFESNTAILTNGEDFGELLAANALAASKNYPVLLTKSNELHTATAAAIEELGITNMLIIGDEETVSEDVVEALEDLGVEVTRISGENRELISIEVAKTYFPTAKKAVIAHGYEFPDALVGGAYAASLNAPIILVQQDSIHADVLEYIDTNFTEVVVLGGPLAVSANVLDALHGVLIN